MVYKDSAGKEIHEGDSLMDLTPGFVGEISEVFLDEDEGELAVNQDGTTIYLYEIDTEVNSLIVNEETMNIEKEEDDDEEKCAVIDTTIGVEPENLSFGEALQALEAGKCVRRESWVGDKFVVKQIDSDIPAEVVPKMQSLPDSAKQFIGKTANGDIHYRNQCLIVKQYPSSTVATNYVPDWNDMFAKDWMVL